MNQIKEKKHRLPSELYIGFVNVAFTVCMMNRTRVFKNPVLITQFTETLITEAANHNCDTLIYLFMPDHLHAILRGTTENAEPLKAMNKFKQKTGYWFSRNLTQAQWQKNYYDHLIRNEESVLKQVRYIMDNPVRGGLVTNWIEYPFKGSTIYNLNTEFFEY